jgi:hypothetical protein
MLYFPQTGYDLNKIIGNGKRFIAYEITERLKMQKEDNLLELIATAVTERERKVNCIECLKNHLMQNPFTTKNFSCRNSITFIIILLVANGI